MNNYINNHNYSTNDKESIDNVMNLFEQFLDTCEIIETHNNQNRVIKPYHQEAVDLVDNKGTTMYINFRHLTDTPYQDLLEVICHEYFKYEKSLRRAVYQFMHRLHPEYTKHKMFYVSFYNMHEVENIRSLKTEKLGKLVCIKGTVTKTTEIRPELIIGNFICNICKTNQGLKEQQFKYTIPKFCINKQCQNQNSFSLRDEGSVFVDWQKIKIQESSNDLPSGAVPRSIDVILRNQEVEKAQPGDRVLITGTLIVIPDVYSMLKPGEKNEMSKKFSGQKVNNAQSRDGIKGLTKLGIKDLNYKMSFLANNVIVNDIRFAKESNIDTTKQQYNTQIDDRDEFLDQLTDSDKREIEQIKSEPNLFSKMANLIAPSVLGNLEIKKGVLLMLFGGVNKKTKDGMKIRGDINICLVGDPSTAKSQFLKFVHNYIPRTVYTSGRGSSSVGLTASLSKDHETGDFTLEAGALMLADNGICCIDEFDKMRESDTVAIHEAMEQQTISITKAGIQATLNARCSILAAMNPIMGRYDKTKNLRSNVRLAPPLMSRFDIFFVLTDECKENIDIAIAKRIVNLHSDANRNQLLHENKKEILTSGSMLRYLKFARFIQPKITQKAKKLLNKIYLRMRTNEFSLQRSAYRVTVRQLESLIRLSESCARIHCSFDVTEEHVREAMKLLNKSIIKIDSGDLEVDFDNDNKQEDQQNNMEIENQNKEIKQHINRSQKLKINKEQYKQIADKLIEIMKNHISENQDQDITPEALNIELLQYQVKEFNSIEDMQQYERLIKAIIKRMTQKEKIFTMYQNEEGEEVIKFHPFFNHQIIQKNNMISWFLSQTFFETIHRIIFSILSLIFIFFYLQAYRIQQKDRNEIIKPINKIFLLLGFIHVLSQFLFSFIYHFSLLRYFQNLCYSITLSMLLNNIAQLYLKDKSDSLRHNIDICAKIIILLNFILFLIQIFHIKSTNECGQNLWFIQEIIFLILWILNLCLIILQLFQIVQTHLRLRENLLDISQNLVLSFKQEKLKYQILLISLFVGCGLQQALRFIIFTQDQFKINCELLFNKKGLIFTLIWSLLDFISLNLLNLALFYVYFWRLRNQFLFLPQSQIRFTEGFDGTRSFMIKTVNLPNESQQLKLKITS